MCLEWSQWSGKKIVRFWTYFEGRQDRGKKSRIKDNIKVSAWAIKNRAAIKWFGEDGRRNSLGKNVRSSVLPMLSLGSLLRSHVESKNDRNITKRFIHCIYNPSTIKVKKLGTAVGRRKTSLQLPAGNNDSAPWTAISKL